MRKTLSGRRLKETKKLSERTISTHCPDKWLFVDLETGDIWSGRSDKFERVKLIELGELSAALLIALRIEEINH